MYRHGTARGLPHALLEVRNDLIAAPAGVLEWADRLEPHLRDILEDREIHATRRFGSAADDRLEKENDDGPNWTNPRARSLRRRPSAVCVEHLRNRTDVQNIDLMNLAGFCRNCLSNWYREAAEERGIPVSKDESREIVYGMPYEAWKEQHQSRGIARCTQKPSSATVLATIDA